MIKVTKTEYGTVYAITGVTGGGGTHTTHQIQKKEWVGLTDKEVVMLAYQSQENECTAIRLAEAKLKEKNHGNG
jgi:hypothetical protein